jgi:hypothetical protein
MPHGEFENSENPAGKARDDVSSASEAGAILHWGGSCSIAIRLIYHKT